MLDIVVLTAIVPLTIAALLPAFWAWRHVVYFWRHTHVTPPAREPCPNVAIILCLRGADPSLDACLHGLLHQDYPRYQLHIVVDNREDPAWSRVHEHLAIGHPANVHVQVQTLEKHCPTCSLKVCSQLQAVARLPDEIDTVALVDADSIPAPDWLRAMVEPLTDPAVGATSGMRWFAPVDRGWGSLVRHIFNAGSYPQMLAFDHPWGGSMTIRTEVFRRSTLKQRWCRSLCEDSALTRPLRETGMKLVFVPAATNINRESITFDASLRFILRQLLCVRLDHVDWPVLLALNMVNSFAVSCLIVLAIAGVCLEEWTWVAAGGGILALFVGGLASALATAEVVIRRNFRLRGQTPPPIVWTWKMIPAFLYTQFICMQLLLRAHYLKQISWRGIPYAIDGPGAIRLEKYEPFQAPAQPPSPQHSVM